MVFSSEQPCFAIMATQLKQSIVEPTGRHGYEESSYSRTQPRQVQVYTLPELIDAHSYLDTLYDMKTRSCKLIIVLAGAIETNFLMLTAKVETE